MYKVGDCLVSRLSRKMYEITRKSEVLSGQVEFCVKLLDSSSSKRMWLTTNQINSLYKISRAARILHSNKVTKAVANEKNED